MATQDRSHALLPYLAWLGFVIYGSLLPFELRDISLDQGIESFFNIRYLDLGVVSRADWVANILLYIPLAYLGCNWVAGKHRNAAMRGFAVFVVLFLCGVTAIGVEFTQTFFAPRTVSLNDLLAEGIGTLIGIFVWLTQERRIRSTWRALAQGGRQSILAAIAMYGVLYLLLALFPFDFLISYQELERKVSSDFLGWVFAANCGLGLRCLAQQVGEIAAILPLGVLLALANPSISLKRVFLAGAAISLAIELIQLFLASGTTQGASVLLRGGGLAAGIYLGQYLHSNGVGLIAGLVRRLFPFLLLPYLAFIAGLNSWYSGTWVGLSTAWARIPDLAFLPFYYQYFTTETHAVASLLAQMTMYAPIGIAVWAFTPGESQTARPGLKRAAIMAALASLLVETGKLFIPPLHPDFTNLVIAASGSAFACWLASWISAAVTHRDDAAPPPVTEEKPDSDTATTAPLAPAKRTTPNLPPPQPIGILLSAFAAIATAAGIFHYPLLAPLLALGLAAYAFALYRNPWLWLAALPIALPILDFSPLSGRQVLDAFDLLVLTSLAIGYWKLYPLRTHPWPRDMLAWAVLFLWTSWMIAFGRGIWPWLDVPESQVAGSHTPLEAWIVGKGLLWALLLVPLLRRLPEEQTARAQNLFLNGAVIGLALLSMMVLWERQVFVGLTDFKNVFRVTGTFASMHTGGAYIEAYLAFAFPILAVWILRQHSWGYRLLGLVVIAASAYAMSVTYSRGGYAGLILSLIVVTLGVVLKRRHGIRHAGIALAATALGAIAIGLPVLSGEFAQSRLNRSVEDLQIRLSHWRQAVSFMNDGVLTAATGMGFGRYPTQYLYGIEPGRYSPGSFSILRGPDGANFLRLTPGDALYLEQVIDVEPETRYTLSARIRLPTGATTLSVPICEKALLYSFGCEWNHLVPQKQEGWQEISIPIQTGNIGAGRFWPGRPVKLSLYNSGSANVLDVDWISLTSADGTEVLANGGFDSGANRWLFVTDRDLAWHIHQQEVETYFAQGILGLLALLALVVSAARILGRGMRAGCTFSLALGGALAGFLVVGLLGSTVDTARLSMLFYFGALAGTLMADNGRRVRLRRPKANR